MYSAIASFYTCLFYPLYALDDVYWLSVNATRPSAGLPESNCTITELGSSQRLDQLRGSLCGDHNTHLWINSQWCHY